MDILGDNMTLDQLVSDFAQGLGKEKATELVKNSFFKIGIPIKEEYSNDEAFKMFEIVEKEQTGFVKTLAGFRMAQTILSTNDMRKISELIASLQSAKSKLEVWSAILEDKIKARTKELEEAKKTLEEKVKERTQELEKTSSTLKEVIKKENECLVKMSNELIIPLNSIISFAEILTAETFGSLNEKQKSYVNYILTNGQSLLAFINEMVKQHTKDTAQIA